MRLLAALSVMALVCAPAFAQQTPSPGALYGCTGITEPRDLQDCLTRNSGLDQRFVPQSDSRPPAGRLLEDRGAFQEESGPPP